MANPTAPSLLASITVQKPNSSEALCKASFTPASNAAEKSASGLEDLTKVNPPTDAPSNGGATQPANGESQNRFSI